MELVLPDEVLAKILSWLPLLQKFIASCVSRQWRRICIHLIRKQRCLVIAYVDILNMNICPCVAESPAHLFTRNDMLVIRGRLQSLQMRSSIFVHCPNLVAVSMSSVFWIRNYELANDLIRSIIERYAIQLQCINCAEFPVSVPQDLPVLEHLNLSTATDLQALYDKLKQLKAVAFTDLNHNFVFPSGLTVLKFMSEPRGLEQVFVSPAAETLEVLSFRTAYNEHLESAQFFLPNLKSMLFHGGMATEVMRDFLSSLQLSSGLQELDLLSLMPGEDILPVRWTDLFSHLPGLKKLRVSKPSIKSDVIGTLVQSCKQLQELCLVDCELDDSSFRLIGSLDHLQVMSLTFNDSPLTEDGILSLLRGQCRGVLSKLVLYRCRGSFLTEVVRHDLLRMKEEGRLSVCKLSCDNGVFDLNQPDASFALPNPF